jgi:hypothetical protein
MLRLGFFSVFIASTFVGGCTVPGLYTSAFQHKGSVQPTVVVEPVTAIRSRVPTSAGNTGGLGDLHVRLRVELPRPCDIGFVLAAVRVGTDLKCTLVESQVQAAALD